MNNADEFKQKIAAVFKAEEDKEHHSAHIKALYQDLKSNGYDVDAVKKVVSDQKKGMDKVKAMENMVELYRNTLGL